MANQAWTYNALIAALQVWPTDADTDYVAQLPILVNLGELRLVRDLNLDIFDRTDASQSTAIGNRLVSKPATVVVMREVGIIDPTLGYTPLEKRSKTFCQFYAPLVAVQAKPIYWYEEDAATIGVVPSPDAIYPVSQYIVARPTDGLAPSAQGPSWLSRCVPDALFAACLMEAEHLIKADDRYADYKSKYYNELLPVARLELRQAIRDGDRAPMKAGPSTQ